MATDTADPPSRRLTPLTHMLFGPPENRSWRRIVAFVAATWLGIVPAALILAPLWVPIAVGANYRDFAARFASAPGIRPTGGVISAVAIFVYLTVALAVGLAVVALL